MGSTPRDPLWSPLAKGGREDQRLFAIVPAAGLSRRMGEPKLLLPLGGKSVVVRLLEALDHPAVRDRLVVVRPDDEPLRAAVVDAGGTVVGPPSAPPDMRASVTYALEEIRRSHSPSSRDGWLLVPADHPVLEPGLIDRLVHRWLEGDDAILVPTCGGRRGHPAFFRWALADEVAAIPPDRGLNWLLRSRPERVAEFAVNDPGVLTDLDTPEDYRRLRERFA